MSLLQTILVGRKPKRTLIRLALLVVCSVVVFRYVVRPARIQGKSMEPTVADGGLRFINLEAYGREGPQRFDVVAIQMAGDRVLYLKRVLGLPGERVAFRSGTLWVDEKSVEESYVEYDGDWTRAEVELGDDEYWVAGDNRAMPMENHVAGVTRRRFIVGRLL